MNRRRFFGFFSGVLAALGLGSRLAAKSEPAPTSAAPSAEDNVRDADLERRLRALHAEVESFYRALWLP